MLKTTTAIYDNGVLVLRSLWISDDLCYSVL